ncbi:cupin domain-containing protein [Nocardia sp. NPDC055321]
MTELPRYFADQPERGEVFAAASEIDALSEILHTVRLRGDGVVRWAPSEPFAVRMRAGTRVMHLVEHGGVELCVDTLPEPLTLTAGDLCLLPTADPHTLRAGTRAPAGEPPRDRCDDLEADDGTRWVTGRFAVEDTAAVPLLSVLPPAIVVPGAPEREWLAVSLRLLLAEVNTPSPGAAVMISRILDLLFIHTLREWAARRDAPPGWLTAALDPVLAPVLSAVHRDPARRWTVTALAELALVSRSGFTERFTRVLGRSPGAYVTDCRLDRAAHLLRSDDRSVGAIAGLVGYDSEAAFSRAFARRFGAPPRRWRTSTPPLIDPSPTRVAR